MSTWLRRIVGGALAVASVVALAALTRLPYTEVSDDEARIRLSWRIRSEQAGACVRPTEEELEGLPQHMRNPDACVGDVPPFRLRVRVDERAVVDERVRPAGARGDRPVYVLRDVSLRPGSYRLEVEFEQERAPESGTERDRAPLDLELEADVRLDARDVVLVTLDSGSRRLVLRR